MASILQQPQVVTLGLDPRALHFAMPNQVQSPRVKPEGDTRSENLEPAQ